jgi:phage terminase large subunit-like protein
MCVRADYTRLHLAAPTHRALVDVLIDGPAGIMRTSPPDARPRWVSSRNRLEWDNGAVCTGFSGESYEQLRGPQAQIAFVDELAAMPSAEDVYNAVQYGLRLGPGTPKLVVVNATADAVLETIGSVARHCRHRRQHV